MVRKKRRRGVRIVKPKRPRGSLRKRRRRKKKK